MKKFNFKLQKILDIREKLELEQKNILTKAASEYQQVVSKRDENIAKVNQSREVLYSQMKAQTVSIQQLQTIDFLQGQVNQLSRSLATPIEEKRKKMEQERVKYNKLVKDRKSMELLKDQELKKYKIAQQRIEVLEMDEIAKNFTKH
jgi:flagellar FliJ protein